MRVDQADLDSLRAAVHEAVTQWQLLLGFERYARGCPGPDGTGAVAVAAKTAAARGPLLPGGGPEGLDRPLSPPVDARFRDLLVGAFTSGQPSSPNTDPAKVVSACYDAARQSGQLELPSAVWPYHADDWYPVAWVWAAEALYQWATVPPPAAPVDLGYDPQLVGEIHRWVGANSSDRLAQTHTAQATILLRRAAEALTPRSIPTPDAAWRAADWYRLMQLVVGLPPSWPPVQIAAFRREWGRLAPNHLDPFSPERWARGDGQRDFQQWLKKSRENARLRLIDRLLAILDDLDAGSQLPTEVWKEVKAFAVRVSPLGYGQPRLVRDPTAAESAECKKVEWAGEVDTLKSSGWVLERSQSIQVIRPAVIQESRPPPDVVELVKKLARAVEKQDPRLAKDCHAIAVTTKTVDWAERLTAATAVEWWRVLQRGLGWAVEDPSLKADVVKLVEACQKVGLTLVDLEPPGPGQPSEVAGWIAYPVSSADGPTPLPLPRGANNYGVGLRYPGSDTILLPDGWLRISQNRLNASPLFRWREAAEMKLNELRDQVKEWHGWAKIDSIVLDAAYTRSEVDPTLAVELFTSLCDQINETGIGELFRALARMLYDQLKTDKATRIRPALNDRLKPESLTAEPEPDVEVQWKTSTEKPGEKPGEILRVLRYGIGKRPPKLELLAGPTGDKVADLLTLEPCPIPTPELDKLVKAVRNVVWAKGSRDKALRAAFADFDSFLLSDRAWGWLTRLARTVTAGTDTPERATARAWWKVLFGAERVEVVQVYPVINQDTWEVTWPADVPWGSEVEWKPDAAVIGHPVGQVGRFATVSEGARGDFSLGPLINRGPVYRYNGVAEAAKPFGSELKAPLADLWAATVGFVLTGRAPTDKTLVKDLLDRAAADIAKGEDDRTTAATRLALAVGKWLAAVSLRLLPTIWDPNRPSVISKLEHRELEVGPIVYNHAKPGEWILNRFGIGSGKSDQILRLATVAKSAGPEPKGLAELREALAAIRTPEAESLNKLIDGWAEASATEKFIPAATNWYMKFWRAAELTIIDSSLPPPWKRAAVAIASLLEEFQITTFSLKKWEDVLDGWAEKVSSDARSSKVRRVLRPGLSKDKKTLVVRALVELE